MNSARLISLMICVQMICGAGNPEENAEMDKFILRMVRNIASRTMGEEGTKELDEIIKRLL